MWARLPAGDGVLPDLARVRAGANTGVRLQDAELTPGDPSAARPPTPPAPPTPPNFRVRSWGPVRAGLRTAVRCGVHGAVGARVEDAVVDPSVALGAANPAATAGRAGQQPPMVAVRTAPTQRRLRARARARMKARGAKVRLRKQAGR